MPEEPQILQPGSKFGQHRVELLLGRGGMGAVYEVEHELTEKRYALKLLNHEMMEVPGVLELFRKEAKVMAHLKHSGIVGVDSIGEDEGYHWLRMELMEGRVVNDRKVITLEDYVGNGLADLAADISAERAQPHMRDYMGMFQGIAVNIATLCLLTSMI